MHYMLLLKGDPAPDQPPSQELVDAMGEYMRELTQAGVLLAAEGLYPSGAGGARVIYQGGRRTVLDGPFAEAKELVAGFYMIDVKSREEAIEWASRCPVHLAVTSDDQEAVVEVRQAASSAAEVHPDLVDPR